MKAVKTSKNEFNLDTLVFKKIKKINVENKIYINTLNDDVIDNDIIKYNSKDIVNFNNNFDNLYKYISNNK